MSTGIHNTPRFEAYIISVEDLNDNVYTGIYPFNSGTANTPGSIDFGNSYGFCIVFSTDMPESSSAGWIVQEAHCTSGLIYTRKKINVGGAWSTWRLTGGTEDTTTKITSTQGNVYARIVGGVVWLSISSIKPIANTWTTIVNTGGLPVKYRPTGNTYCYGHSNSYGKIPMSIMVLTSGGIQVSAETTPSAADGTATCIYPVG